MALLTETMSDRARAAGVMDEAEEMVLMTFGTSVCAVLTSFVAARVVTLQSPEEDAATALGEGNALTRAEPAEIKQLLEQQKAANKKKDS